MSRRWLFRLLAAAPSASDHVPDAELLRRFVASNDSAAFELLIHRHADAVWAAVSRILRNNADAEDAFQATFLVLIRKAKAIRKPCVGGWLHRVAVNAALKLRERSARVSPLEPTQLDAVAASSTESHDAELATAVHEELTRLPERERLPIVLCDLEGLSHADAAKALGWPVGTVSGRLSRARAKLRERLARRGLAPAGALLPALAAPQHLIATAVSLTTTAPPAVVTLTEGVLAAMFTTKLKTGVVLFATAFVAFAGLGTVWALTSRPEPQPTADSNGEKPGQPPTNPKVKAPGVSKFGESITAFPNLNVEGVKDISDVCPKLMGGKEVPIDPKDDALRQLQTARLNANLTEFQILVKFVQTGRAKLSELPTALNRTIAAAAELYPNPKDFRPWLEEQVRLAKWYEELANARVRAAQGTVSEVQAVRAVRLEAEIALLKLIEKEK